MGLDGIKSIWARNTLKISQGKFNFCQFFKYPNLKLILKQSISWTFCSLILFSKFVDNDSKSRLSDIKVRLRPGFEPRDLIVQSSSFCRKASVVLWRSLGFSFFHLLLLRQVRSTISISKLHARTNFFFFFFFFFFGWVLYKPTLMFSRCMFGQTCVVAAVAVVVVAAVVAALCVETLLARSRSG